MSYAVNTHRWMLMILDRIEDCLVYRIASVECGARPRGLSSTMRWYTPGESVIVGPVRPSGPGSQHESRHSTLKTKLQAQSGSGTTRAQIVQK